jgi:hypothetical protein
MTNVKSNVFVFLNQSLYRGNYYEENVISTKYSYLTFEETPKAIYIIKETRWNLLKEVYKRKS